MRETVSGTTRGQAEIEEGSIPHIRCCQLPAQRDSCQPVSIFVCLPSPAARNAIEPPILSPLTHALFFCFINKTRTQPVYHLH